MPSRSYIKLITWSPCIDCHPIYGDVAARDEMLRDLTNALERFQFDCICGIQSQGFLLASLLAQVCSKPLIAIAKCTGKPLLPAYVEHTKDFTGDYKGLYLRKSALIKGASCVIVDDWMETGSQMQAAMNLVKQAGGLTAAVVVF